MRGPNEARRLEQRIFTVPNALSLARLFMVPGVVALLLARADGLAAAVFVLAAVTDFLDGRLARRADSARSDPRPGGGPAHALQRCGGTCRARDLACLGGRYTCGA